MCGAVKKLVDQNEPEKAHPEAIGVDEGKGPGVGGEESRHPKEHHRHQQWALDGREERDAQTPHQPVFFGFLSVLVLTAEPFVGDGGYHKGARD